LSKDNFVFIWCILCSWTHRKSRRRGNHCTPSFTQFYD